LDVLAEMPQNLAPSFVRWRAKRVFEKIGEGLGRTPSKSRSGRRTAEMTHVDSDGGVPLSALEGGAVRAVSAKFCVAKLGSGEVRAFGRYCPHQGADLSLGRVDGEKVMCPWHNLPLDPTSGESPCKSLNKLKTVGCEVRHQKVYISDASGD
jgi:nitrite reductase/ring-hydroxylating ferredoxin subunit